MLEMLEMLGMLGKAGLEIPEVEAYPC